MNQEALEKQKYFEELKNLKMMLDNIMIQEQKLKD
jgi:hypothetical protein